MLSDLARDDLADLRAGGLNPTDADVVRLNALALAITDAGKTTAANLPRFGVAGDVVFWEPTIAAREWYLSVKEFARTEEEADRFFAFACAKGRDYAALKGLHGPDAVRAEVKAFFREVPATWGEVSRAVSYAALGSDQEIPDPTDIAKKRDADLTPSERERRNFAALEQTLAAAAASTGLTFAELMEQTPSRLCAMIYAAHAVAGEDLTPAVAAAHADYLASLKVIADRLKAESCQTASVPPSPEPPTSPDHGE